MVAVNHPLPIMRPVPDHVLDAVGAALGRLFAARPHFRASDDTVAVWIEELWREVPQVEALIGDAVRLQITRDDQFPSLAKLIDLCAEVRASEPRRARRRAGCGQCSGAMFVDADENRVRACEYCNPQTVAAVAAGRWDPVVHTNREDDDDPATMQQVEAHVQVARDEIRRAAERAENGKR